MPLFTDGGICGEIEVNQLTNGFIMAYYVII